MIQTHPIIVDKFLKKLFNSFHDGSMILKETNEFGGSLAYLFNVVSSVGFYVLNRPFHVLQLISCSTFTFTCAPVIFGGKCILFTFIFKANLLTIPSSILK